jgi:exonuclease III
MNFNLKFTAVQNFEADILLVQECEKLPRDHFEGFDFHWVGENTKKGLGVLTRGPSEFPQEIYRSDFIYFIPVTYGGVFILGVWAFNDRAQKISAQSSGYFLDALAHYSEQIQASSEVVIAGDFNNGPQWDVPGHRNNFVGIDSALNALELHSAYHVSKLEEFGKETSPTYFHQRNLEKTFHIDYVYANLDLIKSVEVGSYSDWCALSDHVPVTVLLR